MKRFITYLILGLAILILSNLIYSSTGLLQDDEKNCTATLHHTMDSLALCDDALYFSESSNFTYAETDSFKKSISELLQEQIPHLKIGAVQQGAIHAGVYKTLIKRLPVFSRKKTIFIAINLRSFGINWIQSLLETNIDRANIFYTSYPPILKKFLVNFKAYDHQEDFQRKQNIKWHYKHDLFEIKSGRYTNVRSWDSYVFANGIVTSGGQINRDTTELACHFIKNYAFKLDEENIRIKDLLEIVKLCKSKKISLVFHILPENFELAKSLIGPDLTGLMQENISFIHALFSQDVLLIDNSQLLGQNHFIDKNWPTEHYDDQGRIEIAKKIANRMK